MLLKRTQIFSKLQLTFRRGWFCIEKQEFLSRSLLIIISETFIPLFTHISPSFLTAIWYDLMLFQGRRGERWCAHLSVDCAASRAKRGAECPSWGKLHSSVPTPLSNVLCALRPASLHECNLETPSWGENKLLSLLKYQGAFSKFKRTSHVRMNAFEWMWYGEYSFMLTLHSRWLFNLPIRSAETGTSFNVDYCKLTYSKQKSI